MVPEAHHPPKPIFRLGRNQIHGNRRLGALQTRPMAHSAIGSTIPKHTTGCCTPRHRALPVSSKLLPDFALT
jgi:hypothetical protein